MKKKLERLSTVVVTRLVEPSRCAAISFGGVERVDVSGHIGHAMKKNITHSRPPLGIKIIAASSRSKVCASAP